MRRLVLLPLLALSLAGCAPGDCKVPAELLPGVFEGSLDGAAWQTTDASWAEAGASLQLGHSMVDGVMMSIVLNHASDSQPVQDLLDAEELPFEVILGAGEDGGWVTVYQDDSTSSFHTQNAAGGVLTFSARDGDILEGCMHFEAATNDGDQVSSEEGVFRFEKRVD
jgi:hypothetical protein